MKILQINKFFYLKGGSERYMFDLSDLLEVKGHNVSFFSMDHKNNMVSKWSRYFVKNISYNKKHNVLDQIRIFKNTLYSKEAERNILRILYDFKPDIAHIHNFNHQLTPSILFALKKKNVPAVMTVHDYKLVCPSYSMFNHGEVCELCSGKRFYQCFKTRCHKHSFSKSLLAYIVLFLHHQILNSYKTIKYFICPSKFIKDKIQEMGLRGYFIHLPNFVNTRHLKPTEERNRKKLVYWGRLSYGKGVVTLVEAMKGLPAELDIIGDGPLKAEIKEKIKKGNIKNVRVLGSIISRSLFGKAKESYASIIPSEWYENNPMSVLEAFSLGKAVIGSRIGGIPELVRDGGTGLLFEPGNSEDLRNKIGWLINNPDKAAQMGRNARTLVEKECNAELHYKCLMKIYSDAISMRE